MNSAGIHNEDEENDESLRPKPAKRIKLEHNADSGETTSAVDQSPVVVDITAAEQPPADAPLSVDADDTSPPTTEASDPPAISVDPQRPYTKQELLDYFEAEYDRKRQCYVDRLLELFYLEYSAGNATEYYAWRKKTPQTALLQYFRQVANDDETEYENLQYDKAKLDGLSLSSLKITPIAQLKLQAPNAQLAAQPPNQTAGSLPAASHHPAQSPSTNATSLSSSLASAKDSSHHPATSHTPAGTHFTTPSPVLPSKSSVNSQSSSSKGALSSPFSTPTYHHSHYHAPTSKLTSQLHSVPHFSKSLPSTPIGGALKKSQRLQHTLSIPTGPYSLSLHTPSSAHTPSTPSSANISSVYESSIGSKEQIVERARQEASVIQRIAELRKEGLWSAKRLPRIQEPPREKAHWDYLLEEMTWLATDFAQERKWKRAAAKKCARMIMKYHEDKKSQVQKAEKENLNRLRKIASSIAKEVRQFWASAEKLVEFKINTKLEEKRKKALDIHLNFIVDQTEKYSSWLAEGLNKNPSTAVNEEPVNEVPMNAAPVNEAPETEDSNDAAESAKETSIEKGDDEFNLSQDEEDVEDTIAEQEKIENDDENKQELDDLENEANIPIEKLLERYKDLYANEAGDESMDAEEEDEEQSEEGETTTMNESDEEQSAAEDEEETKEEIGVEYLVNLDDSNKTAQTPEKKSGPSVEITDIAAGAQSLQPKGNTLSTATIQTKVPFLLKGQLREYQLIGLDWLVQMYEKKLNGVLADEMGLGKTIQTIAMLAHLACEKGIWGPHLIVVPTSVMLNWEIEIRRWCPAFKIITYYGSPKERKLKRQGWTKPNQFHICITSYKLVLQDHASFRRKRWEYLILDEAQHIKNFKSQRWQMLLNFNTNRRLLLTGTPLQNNLMELWSLLHFLMPTVFKSHKDFREWFVNPVNEMIEGKEKVNNELIDRLHKILRPFLLRRVKVDVEKQLPKKFEHVLPCRLSKRQRFLYEEFMSLTKTKETLASGNFLSVINILMQLRKVCNHPNLFETRPVQSPFSMSGLTYSCASLATTPTDYDPFRNVDLHALSGNLIDLCSRYSAADIHRINSLQVPSRMIEEIDQIDLESPPPAPVVKFQTNKNFAVCRASVPHSLRIRNLQQQNTNNSFTETDELKKPTNQTSLVTRKPPALHLEKLIGAKPSTGNHLDDGLLRNDEIELRRENDRREKLRSLARVNKAKCNRHSLYTKDLLNVVDVHSSPRLATTTGRAFDVGQGYFSCLHNQNRDRRPTDYEHYSDALSSILRTPEELLAEMNAEVERFTFVIPAASAPKVKIHIPHQAPSKRNLDECFENTLHYELVKKTHCLHRVLSNMAVQFPELRLIQYDCGKLQTLDKLLWKLKAGGHRCLIFTQMSRMLDIFEQFLNHHGHTYLRLDGSTRIEQRQALMERFNADTRIFCFILSTRSGGVGVNLTGADTVIFYDSDWNPSLDNQAQDRCHRIGQTRDVHIYRLVSEKTVEENILKKARQKQFLGELAIEGGSFTTAYFKNDSIRELFNVNSAKENVQSLLQGGEQSPVNTGRPLIEEIDDEKTVKYKSQLGAALHAVEDESDVAAAKTAMAEASAEFAEFDENIPIDVDRAEEKSPEEKELEELVSQLTPVERYAMQFLESIKEPMQAEQLKQAEEEIEAQKKEWELGHLKSLKEENERALMKEQEQDEMLTMSKDEVAQVFISSVTEEVMPIWAPPTPPQDENDLYCDYSLGFLYEREIMTESQLPPVYIPKESKRIRLDNITNRKQAKIRKDENVNIPRSLFDKPSPFILKLRKEVKVQKLRGFINGGPDISQLQRILNSFGSNYTLPQPTTLQQQAALSKQPNLILHGTQQESQIHWGINEDWALVEIIQYIQELPINLIVLSPGHIPNWDFVSAHVNSKTSTYRSPKLCRHHYETVILPKEEGRGTGEPPTKKLKKLQKQQALQAAAAAAAAAQQGAANPAAAAAKNQPAQIRPVKISNLFVQDNNTSFTQLTNSRFNNILTIANKRQPTIKPVFVNPQAGKNPKHMQILQESHINYDQPLLPTVVAQNRADRIAREAREKQQQLTEQNLARQKLIQLQKQQQQQIIQTPIKNVAVPVQAASVQQSPAAQPTNIVISTNTPNQPPTGQFQAKLNPIGANTLNVSKASVQQFVATPTSINPTSISQQQILNIAKGLQHSATNFQLQFQQNSAQAAQQQQQQQTAGTAATAQTATGQTQTIQTQIIPSVSVSNVIQAQSPRIAGTNISVNQTALPRIVAQAPVSITAPQSLGASNPVPANAVYSVTSIPNQSKFLTATITNSPNTAKLTPAQLATCRTVRPQFVLQRPTSQIALSAAGAQQPAGQATTTQLVSNARVQIATNNLIQQPTAIQTAASATGSTVVGQAPSTPGAQNIVRATTAGTIIATSNPLPIVPISSAAVAGSGNAATAVGTPKIPDIQIIHRNPRVQTATIGPPSGGQQIAIASLTAKPVSSATGQLQAMALPISANQNQRIFGRGPPPFYARKPTDEELEQINANRNQNIAVTASTVAVQAGPSGTVQQTPVSIVSTAAAAANLAQQPTQPTTGSVSLPGPSGQQVLQFLHIPTNQQAQQNSREGTSTSTGTPTFLTIYTSKGNSK